MCIGLADVQCRYRCLRYCRVAYVGDVIRIGVATVYLGAYQKLPRLPIDYLTLLFQEYLDLYSPPHFLLRFPPLAGVFAPRPL